ncbi:MAG: PSD1 and planctomycete cytochrome C domain-containing protein [Gemmataceae bacterium]
MTRWIAVLPLLALVAAPAAAQPAKLNAEQTQFFETKIRPVLAENCFSCHGEKKQSAGLRLDTAAGVKQGADDGAVIVPGDPTKSRLIKSVKREGDYAMPPKDALRPEQVADLTEWVRTGAPFPADQAVVKGTDPTKHWAFQPVKPQAPPETKRPTAHAIDAFVVSKLEAKGLAPSAPADRRTLLRRAYYDLIGLPPTGEEIKAFETDQTPGAFEAVIDRLLASPHYGERWGRHWLDVARYADTKGYVFQEEKSFPFAYTYRDYVIRSINEDKPFDRFVVEQLAADRLPLGEDKSALAAMGFLTLGRRFLNNTHDIIDDRIDVVTRGLMGLSVACARCHDHKYDPIPAKDYYSLYGVFASSVEPKQLPLLSEKRTPEQQAFDRELAKKEAEIEAEKVRRFEAEVGKLRGADALADYLRAALDARGKTPEQVQAFARERDLNGFVLGRWRPYLTEQLKAGNPVLTPLAALHALPEAEFAAKSAAALDGVKEKAHPAVMTALTAAKPKTFREAATAVGKVIAQSKDDTALAAITGKGGPLDISVADADKLFNRVDRDALVAARKKVDAFQASNPNAPQRAHVLVDGNVQEPVVFLRGNPGNRGPAVPRQMVAVAAPNRQPFKQGSGRLELANAIASPDNPLTARVFVNRVWAGHFGHGLVRTPSDFGVRSDPPTHPELLDWLANRFVTDGWSPKRLHRLIMTSAAYQQASVSTDELFRADPENKLLARQNRRRLDFESLRDSLLVGSGKLDRTVYGRPVDLFKAPFPARRSVYGLIDRLNPPGTLRVFDVANPDQHSPQRFLTTVPQQALFLMNSPFVQEQAKALAARPEVTSAGDPDEKVTALYRLALGRTPTPAELGIGREYVAAGGRWEQYAQVLLLSNEFAFVD